MNPNFRYSQNVLSHSLFPRMMATRVTLDNQGRLILRENGKIVLPYEHFANAVMLKHMNGPHGLHLGIEATVRAVSLIYKSLFVIIYLSCDRVQYK